MHIKSTVLIVDDEPNGREVLNALLHTQGYHLLFAADGYEALELAFNHTPDVILLDVMMPGMDGFEVCQRLRANPRTAEVAIVMVTALDDRASRVRGIEAGADDFLSKPIDRLEIQARVRTITRINRYRRLLDERARFEWVIEQADDGYLLLDEQDRILYANRRARAYLAVHTDDDQLIGGSFMDLIQQSYHCEPEALWAHWRGQAAQDGILYLVRPESAQYESLWLQVTILDQSTETESRRLIGLRNVTSQIINQRHIQTFHGILHHKLRTPLVSMSLSMEMLAESDYPIAPEEVKDIARISLQGVRRLQSEINDILSYVRAPEIAHDGTGCSCAELASLAHRMSTELKLIDVTVTGHEQVQDVQLLLSARAVESILWELLENAKKFHPQQSPAVKVRIDRSGEQAIRLRVMDNGIHLPLEHLERMWTPYYQGEKSFTGEIAGMGLGLSMVASLVWSIGGSCRSFNRTETPGIVIELFLPYIQQ